MIDALTGKEHTGERFSPTASDIAEIDVNLRRYLAVLPHIKGKNILDLGCGNGLGTYLYSLVAQSVFAVDRSSEALAYAHLWPFEPNKVAFERYDLVNEFPAGSFDLAVALEILEHLDDPRALLTTLKDRGVKELYFSLPLNSLHCSTWHRFNIVGLKDVTDLIDPFIRVDKYNVSDGRWITGHGKFR